MGKGDQRTGQGKLRRGTYGKTRPRKKKKRTQSSATVEKTPKAKP